MAKSSWQLCLDLWDQIYFFQFALVLKVQISQIFNPFNEGTNPLDFRELLRLAPKYKYKIKLKKWKASLYFQLLSTLVSLPFIYTHCASAPSFSALI